MTDEQFKQASDFLREVHKNVRLYWTDTTEIVQAMSSGEVDLAWAWNDAGVQSATGRRADQEQARHGRGPFDLGVRLCACSRMRRAAPTRPMTS